MLLTWHNISYYQDLMAGLRAPSPAIEAGQLAPRAIAPPIARRAWAEPAGGAPMSRAPHL